jgi:hypothetical protein
MFFEPGGPVSLVYRSIWSTPAVCAFYPCLYLVEEVLNAFYTQFFELLAL